MYYYLHCTGEKNWACKRDCLLRSFSSHCQRRDLNPGSQSDLTAHCMISRDYHIWDYRKSHIMMHFLKGIWKVFQKWEQIYSGQYIQPAPEDRYYYLESKVSENQVTFFPSSYWLSLYIDIIIDKSWFSGSSMSS